MKKIVVLTLYLVLLIEARNPYPSPNHTTTDTSDGLPSTVTDPATGSGGTARGVTRYTYDTPGNLTRVLQPSGKAVDYTYDLIGNRLSMSTSAGTTNYGYDAANQLTEVTGPNSAVTTFAYDNIGLRTQKALPNGVTTNYGYDTLNRLTNINQQKGGTTVASYAYILDAAGNRLSVTEAGGNSIQWSYDDAYRLTNETRKSGSSIVAQSSFTYDLAGNRLRQQSMVNGQSSTVQYTYNELDQLLTAGPIQYQYDGRGNQISATNSGQTVQYRYDAQNRLVNTSLPDGTNITNTYDVDGRRVKQVVDSLTTNYLWDEASIYGDVVLETGSGNTTSYVLAGSEILSQTRNGSTSYYLQDGQGSTRGLANSAGNITDTYDYTAFGEIYNQTGATVNPYLYAGQQFDDSSGLYSLRARYYNPTLGRFLSQDTYGINFRNPIELNRYVYTANNSINYSDPSGNQAFTEYAINMAKKSAAVGAVIGAGFGLVNSLVCGGNLFLNIGAGALLGAGFGAGSVLYPGATSVAAIGLGTYGLGSSAVDMYHNGFTACNILNAAGSLAAIGLGGLGLNHHINNNLLGGLGEIGYPDEMLNPSMGHDGYYMGGYQPITIPKTGAGLEMPTSLLNFTQSGASPVFGRGLWEGLSIEEVGHGLRDGSLTMDEPLLVFLKTAEMNSWPTTTYKGFTGSFANLENGRYYSINNRGLATAIFAEKNTVPVRLITDPETIIHYSYEFDTNNFGTSIWIRGLNYFIEVLK